jgi:hypothetical protein
MADNEDYECPRCGYTTSKKGNLVAHLKTKTVCSDTNDKRPREEIIKQYQRTITTRTVECQYCNKQVCYKNYSRHLRVCKDKPDDNVTSQQCLLQEASVEKQVLVSESTIKTIISTVFQEMVKHKHLFAPNITNNTVNNTMNLQINSFGNEDTTHLTHEFLSHCLQNPTKGITSLIDSIHYSDEKPSNRNIRYKSAKQNTFEKYLDNQWIECDASNTLDELIRRGYRVLNAHYTEYFLNDPSFDGEVKRIAIEKFRFLSDKTSNEYYAVKRDLRLLIKNKTLYIVAPPNDEEDDDDTVMIAT